MPKRRLRLFVCDIAREARLNPKVIRRLADEGRITHVQRDYNGWRIFGEEAIEEAINSPLIEVDITDANGALVNVTGGADMTVGEAQKVAEIVQSRISTGARIIWGAAVDPTLDHSLKVMVVITGVKSRQIMGRTETAARAPAKEVGIDFIQ